MSVHSCESSNKQGRVAVSCVLKRHVSAVISAHLTLEWLVPRGTVNFPENPNVFRDEIEGNVEILGKQISLFPKGPVIKWFVILQNKWVEPMMKTNANFEKRTEIPATTSGHLQLHALITCSSGQYFAGNSDLSPNDGQYGLSHLAHPFPLRNNPLGVVKTVHMSKPTIRPPPPHFLSHL